MIRRCSAFWFSVVLLLATVTLSLPTMAFSAEIQYGYVTDTFFSQIYVLDLTNNAVVGQPIDAGAGANLATHGVIVSPDGNQVYVANENGQSISQITLNNKTITSDDVVVEIPISGDYTGGITTSPNGRFLYVAHIPAGYPFRSVLTVIDTDPPAPGEGEPDPGPFPVVDSIILKDGSLANQPFDIEISPDGRKLYISNKQANAIYVVNTNPVLGAVELAAEISVGNDPHGLAVSPDGSRVYVANTGDNSVSVIDPTLSANNAEIDIIENVGLLPWRIVAHPDPAAQTIYVTNSGEDTVSIINTANKSVTTATVGLNSAPRPRGIDINTAGTRVYVTNSLEDTVSVIETDNSNTVTTFAVSETALNLQAIAAEQEPHGVISVNDVSLPNVLAGESLLAPVNVFVYNVGIASMHIWSVGTPQAPFSIVGNTCNGADVLPNSSCFFRLQFEPTANSLYSETIVIDTDYFDASVKITGVGVSSVDNQPPTAPKLISPADGAGGLSSTVTFVWEESTDPDGNDADITYEVHYMPFTDWQAAGNEFDESATIVTAAYIPETNILYAGMGLSSLLILGGALRSRKHKAMLVLLTLAATLLLAACGGGGGGGTSGGGSEPQQISLDVTGFTPDSYVWKVVAYDNTTGVTDSAATNLFHVTN